ncbi:MAG TPA: CheR family methyltransferase [Prolixibacteraceae bacterium]
MKVKYALDISMYETSFLGKAIQNRMTALSSETVDDYLLLLENSASESLEMVGQLSNSYSTFFRNPLTFTCLEQIILPSLIGQKIMGQDKEIRIWSAACASGQEAYSMAILFDELAQNTKVSVSCHIFATDIDPSELDKARSGVYRPEGIHNVSYKRIKTYFTQQGETFTLVDSPRKYVDFSVFDLLGQQCNCPPASVYGNFDLVFCSNLLFYYKPEYRQRIIDKAGNCLVNGGYLVTGETERGMLNTSGYREVYPHSGIFQKR